MNRGGLAQPRLLHCFAREDGASAARAAAVVKAIGGEIDHAIVFASEPAPGVARQIPAGANVHYPASFPDFGGKPSPRKLARLAQAMAGFDLVLTYDWGALNVAMAHTAFAQNFNLPPLIHHEIGFAEDGVPELGLTRNWYRRIALGRAFALVVETESLEGVALTQWQQPIGRIRRIAGGIATADFNTRPASDALPGIIKHDGEAWVGTVCDLAPEFDLPDLVGICAPLPPNWHLVIWGDGPDRDAIRAQANRLDIGHRVHLPGKPNDVATALGLLDIYVARRHGHAFPEDLAQAMAAGLPVLAARGTDAHEMLVHENHPLLPASGDAGDAAARLGDLADDAQLRAALGAANRRAAQTRLDIDTMIGAYRRLYASALQREIA